MITIKKTSIAVSLTALLFVTASAALAQSTTTTTTTTVTTTTTNNIGASNYSPTVFVELLGPGLTFSANYDMRFTKSKDGIGGRIGIGYIADDGASITTLPIQLNYLMGKNGKYFEVGGGATYAGFSNRNNDFLSFDGSGVVGTLTFGYRYQPVDGGFNFRASFNPLFNSENFVPFIGLSFGYTFK